MGARKVGMLLAVLAGACFVVYLLVGLNYGPIISPDGKRDAAYALNLIGAGFNPIEYLETVDMPQPGVQYLVYIYLLAFCRLLAGPQWFDLLILFNVLAYTLAAYLTMSMAAIITRSLVGVVVVFFSLTLGFEYYQWISISQSEALFILVVVAVLYFVIRAWTAPPPATARRAMVFAVGLAIVSFFVRPTSPPVVGLIVAALILKSQGNFSSPRILRGRLFLLTCAGAIALAGIILLVAVFTHDPALLPPSKVRDVLVLYREYFLQGAVVLVRPETFIEVSDSVWGFASVSFLRLIYFFGFLADEFSFSHTFINVAYSVPLYALAILGMATGLLGNHPEDRIAPLIGAFFSLALIVLFDVYHAVTILDYNWRYRAPAYPAIFLLAAQGSAWITERFLHINVPQGKRTEI